jgi:hypothetical protein
MKTVTLISKDECSLCDIALEKLERIQREKQFELVVKKIEPGTPDHERYGEKIPVVLVDDIELCYYKVDERRLKSIL